MEQRLQQIIVEVIAERGAWWVEWQTMPDHVQLVVEVDPQSDAAAGEGHQGPLVAGAARGVPVAALRLPSLWTNSYFVATVGGAPRSVITRYVESQKSR